MEFYIKSDNERSVNQVLKDFRVDPKNASKEQREYAREIERKTAEIEKRGKR